MSAHEQGMELRVWGARGSIPTPGPANRWAGGNTTCLELLLPGGGRLIVDAGTGILGLGQQLAAQRVAAQAGPQELDLLLTHFHWDHIQGLPFFAPLYAPGNRIRFHSGCPAEELERALCGQMKAPYFPVDFNAVRATTGFHQAAEPFVLGAASVQAFALHHPGGSFGYRIACGGASVVIATDHEMGDPAADETLLRAAAGADLLLIDAQFTPDELRTRRGWGHSSWLEATSLARRAGVGHLVLFHHDPSHGDEQLRAILAEARQEFAATSLAIEGFDGSPPAGLESARVRLTGALCG